MNHQGIKISKIKGVYQKESQNERVYTSKIKKKKDQTKEVNGVCYALYAKDEVCS